MLNIIFIFFFGLIIWSFINAYVYRSRVWESILFWRSQCVHCNKILWFKDLFPVFSWLFLKWKCRFCNNKISIFYILWELFFWIWYVLLMFSFFWLNRSLYFQIIELANIDFIKILFVFTLLWAVSIYDILYMEILDKLIIPVTFFVLILDMLWYWYTSALDWFKWAMLIYSFFYIQILIPWVYYSIKLKKYKYINLILYDFLIFPLWMLIRLFLDEHKTNKISIFKKTDIIDLPLWIWWWDLRMAFFIGLLLWFHYWALSIAISYIAWSVIWIIIKIIWFMKNKSIREVPLIPFLSIWTIISLIIKIN